MALTSKGTDIALKRNDTTGRFDYRVSTAGTNKGNPELGSDQTHACMTTLFSRKRGRLASDTEHQGGYYFDTSGRRGSLLWTVKYDRSATRSDLISAAQDAGQQLVDAKLIASYQVDASRMPTSGLRRWRLDFAWTLPSGQQRTTERLTL